MATDNPQEFDKGDRVVVSLPFGMEGAVTRQPGTVGVKRDGEYHVIFDDELVYGGLGHGWFGAEMLEAE